MAELVGKNYTVSKSSNATTRASATDLPFIPMKERKRYNRWRVRILISIILGYAAYYLCRQNLSMVVPAFIEELGYTKTELGLIFSIASIIYGIGKFVNGYLSDLSNARYFMPIGLFCSAIISFFFGFNETLLIFGFGWILNNWFQSMGWPPVARMLTHWFAPKELGTKWALGAASHQIGGAVTLILCGYLVTHLGWQYAFWIPSIIAIIVAIALFTLLRESPQKLNLPNVETYKGEIGYNIIAEDDKANFSTREIVQKVFTNKNIWYVCLANMFLYIVRLGITIWGPLFLIEYKGISLTFAGWQVALFEAIGLVGGLAAGLLSDRVFKGKRSVVGAFFMIALAGFLILFWQMPTSYELLSSIIFIFIGFFVYGPQILVGVVSAQFASKKAVGTANGLVGTFGYIGSAISGICIGIISDRLGWEAVFMFFIASSLIGGLFFYLTHKAQKQK